MAEIENPGAFIGSFLRAEKDGGHSGFFIGLQVPMAAANAMKLEGGEPVESLHMTLIYSKDGGDGDREQAAAMAREVAARHLPLAATIGGFGRFPASPQSDGKDVIIGLVDAPGLELFRNELLHALAGCGIAPSRAHGFCPHVTLAYVEPAAPTPVVATVGEVAFEVLQVNVGNAAPSEMLVKKELGHCPMCGGEPGCNIDCARCAGGEALVVEGFPIGVVRDGARTVDPAMFYAACEMAKVTGNVAALEALLAVEKDIIASGPPGSPGMRPPGIGGAKMKMRRGAPVKDPKKFLAYARKERFTRVASTEVLERGEELVLLDPDDPARIYGIARVGDVVRVAAPAAPDVLDCAVTMLGDGEPVCTADVEVVSFAPDGARVGTEIAVEKDQIGPQKVQSSHGPISYVSHKPGWTFPILSKNAKRQTIMCVAIEPNATDVHKHEIPEDIADSAMYDYMANYRLRTTRPSTMPATGIGAFHQIKHVPDVHIVQIFKVGDVTGGAAITINGKTIPPAAWVVVLWVLNPAYWARIESGEINGVSIDGDAYGGPPSS